MITLIILLIIASGKLRTKEEILLEDMEQLKFLQKRC